MQLIEQTLDDTLGESQASATPVAPSNASQILKHFPNHLQIHPKAFTKTLLAFPSTHPNAFRNISHNPNHSQTHFRTSSNTSQITFKHIPKHFHKSSKAPSNTSQRILKYLSAQGSAQRSHQHDQPNLGARGKKPLPKQTDNPGLQQFVSPWLQQGSLKPFSVQVASAHPKLPS